MWARGLWILELMCDVHTPQPLYVPSLCDFPRMKDGADAASGTCVLNAGKRCWLCCSAFQVLRELGGVASDVRLPLRGSRRGDAWRGRAVAYCRTRWM